jgi:hypothetical protein
MSLCAAFRKISSSLWHVGSFAPGLQHSVSATCTSLFLSFVAKSLCHSSMLLGTALREKDDICANIELLAPGSKTQNFLLVLHSSTSSASFLKKSLCYTSMLLGAFLRKTPVRSAHVGFLASAGIQKSESNTGHRHGSVVADSCYKEEIVHGCCHVCVEVPG